MNRSQLIAKIGRVIHSCETLEQLRVAHRYAMLGERAAMENSECFEDAALLFAIKAEIRDKKKQIMSSTT